MTDEKKVKTSKGSSASIEIKQIRSAAGRTKKVKAALSALGLGRISNSKVIPSNPATLGMIKKLNYLLEVKSK